MALLDSIARRLFRDLGLKLAAIFLATALYSARPPRDRTNRGPPGGAHVALRHRRPRAGGLPDSVTVRIRATASQITRLVAGPVTLQADLCGAEPGALVLRQFSGADLVLPPTVTPPFVAGIEPTGVYVRASRAP
jgi:hypothetical protein